MHGAGGAGGAVKNAMDWIGSKVKMLVNQLLNLLPKALVC